MQFLAAILVCFFLSVSWVVAQANDEAVVLEEQWTLDSFLRRPESVIYHPGTQLLYVSNINGGGVEKNNRGYITTVNLEGQVIKSYWLAGLNAPKGLALSGNTLYIADIDELIVVDIPAAKITQRYPAEGATFLNDVAIDAQGNVYVSDSWSSLIYKLPSGGSSLEIWIDDEAVRNPNGVYAEQDHLVVAAGDLNGEPLNSKKPGSKRYLKTIDYSTGDIKPLHTTEPVGGIDAIEADGQGGYWLSDWKAGKVMHYSAQGQTMVLLERESGTADLTYLAETNTIYLPLMEEQKLMALGVGHAAQQD